VRAEIVAVGTELLLGQIPNTNARWMSEELAAIGVDVVHHQAVGDNLERILDALRLAGSRADVVLATGGLGPTQDDITRDAIAALLGVGMVRHPEIEELLRGKFLAFGIGEMPVSNLGQADVPEGASYITPSRGTAPGLVAELSEGGRLYAVPGVPEEMMEMMRGTILPALAAEAGSAAIRSQVLRCTGIGESAVAELVADLFAGSPNPTIAFLSSTAEVRVRVTAKAESAKEAERMIQPVLQELERRLGDHVFTVADESLEEAVVRLLAAKGVRLSGAESLTGGGLGARITSVPGASAAFVGSAVVYTNEAKVRILDVSRATLEGPGPVSEACAREMAEGARRVFGTDLGLAVTGAAGPEPHGGATPGTVWLALAADGLDHVRRLTIPGERDRVRRASEQASLDLVRRHLEGRALPGSDPTG
jgi:nicotinamide-nucleotide amidase